MKNRTEGGSVAAFKGFSPDWKCRGMQYELGQSFAHEGDVQACKRGLHACEHPLDVWSYYPPVCESTRNLNRFASVTASGTISRESGGDSKIAAATLKVEAELKIPDLVACAVRWVMQHIDGTVSEGEERSAATNTGNYSAATNTGNKSAATNTGNYSAATNTGFQSAATNTGFQSAATNTGNYSAATNTGFQSAATNTGNYSAATNTGFQSAATNTGFQSAATNTGNYSAATNTGNKSAATNTGNYSAASVEGAHSVAAATGIGGRAKAPAGSAIVLCLRNEDGELQAIRSAIVGESSGLKSDTWYSLDNSGEFVEVAA